METWKSIAGFDNYEISNLGRVRSKRRIIHYSDGRIRTYASKMLVSGESVGYPFVNLINGKTRKSIKIHVLVANAFIGQRPFKYDICHINGDKHDNRVENLEYGTRSKNILDNYNNNGQINSKQKLSPMLANEIRRRIGNGESLNSIAKTYCVAKSTINAINKRKLYKTGEANK